MPLPSQVGQTFGTVPALAPVPWHGAQAASDTICMPTVTPSIAWTKSTVTSPSTSLPRRGPRLAEVRVVAVRVPPAPLNSPPKRSEKPVSPAWRNRSSTDGPPPEPEPPLRGKRKPPPPKRRRASSYSLRLLSLESTSLASDTSLKRRSASALPGFWSGWFSRASLR